MEGENRPRLKGLRRFTRTIVILAILILAFCIWFFFLFRYSTGDRVGRLVKISTKGNIFQTHEGEMWISCHQTMYPEKFYFSVTNDSLMRVLKELQDQCVQVTYTQYKATLPWRGDSKYIVKEVRKVNEPPQ